ncbi:glycosyltransferase family protein [Allorhizobium taibaishanense]|uniref:Capsular biosynthesis protein n=1 Tax=Allorhizobium taibaishanense TaxID=887144 RepID=A0A1Q9A3U1_9HYPH|nr:hypothetical protein [Allorhizobium taibaishanense]MBB4006280.1 hypothetical protein [Allorhizobium taibaishanense]OLP49249.1 hypothetical protein BJF91_19465 [Allorhizobium taibaishanense]
MQLSQPITVNLFRASKEGFPFEAFAEQPHPSFRFSLIDEPVYRPCDVAVFFGSFGRTSSPTHSFRTAIAVEHQGPLLTVEVGFWGRETIKRSFNWYHKLLGHRRSFYKFKHHYFRIGLDGTLPGDADFLNANSPSDRWDKQSAALGLTLKPYRKAGEHVLIIGQIPGDAAMRGMDVCQWLGATARSVRRLTDRPIIVRPHPGMKNEDFATLQAELAKVPNLQISGLDSLSSVDELARAHCTICYTSSFALDSLLAGVPVITLSRFNIAAPVCSRRIEDVVDPPLPEREQLFYDIAYAHWTPEEIRSGEVWARFAPVLVKRCQPGVRQSRPVAAPLLAPSLKVQGL